MRLLVVGAGSTGGYVGGRLAEKGRDVTFLVRPGRAAQLRDQGLRITSPHGNITLQPKLLTAGQITAPFDAILLTVKGFQLESAMADIAPAIGLETMILPFLNGMRHMEVLSRRFTPHNVPGCVLKIMTVLEDDGRIVQLTPMIDLAYGELTEPPRPVCCSSTNSCRARMSAPVCPPTSTAKCGKNGFCSRLSAPSPA